MSVFDLEQQNNSLDLKIVAGLERIAQAFRILLWEKAKVYGLSPIQIQLLIFIKYHSQEKTTVSYLAREFNLTKPTISDAVKVLLQKGFITKQTDSIDTRSYTVLLTEEGNAVVDQTQDFANPVTDIVSKVDFQKKQAVWQTISTLIIQLNKIDLISVQRTCPNCRFYAVRDGRHYCNLLDKSLENTSIRIDCPEFEAA
jgi:DNA-binding MarR family transcriptional regulator